MLLVAPEHRLSLHLKWHELWARGDDAARATCGALDLVRAVPCVDLLDESDELLHHRWAEGGEEGLVSCIHGLCYTPSLTASLALLSLIGRPALSLLPTQVPAGVRMWLLHAAAFAAGAHGCHQGAAACGVALHTQGPLTPSAPASAQRQGSGLGSTPKVSWH